MAYAPGISYHGDQYLAQGMGELGDAIARAIQNRNESEALDAVGQQVLASRTQMGMEVDPALIEKFSKGGLSTKRAMLGQWAADTHLQMQQQLQKAQIKHYTDEDAYRVAHAEALARDKARQEALPGLVSDWASAQRGDATGEPMTAAQAFQFAAANNPAAVTPEMLVRFGAQADQAQVADEMPGMPFGKPVQLEGLPGQFIVRTGPRESRIVTQQSAPVVTELVDEEGNPTGQRGVMVNGRMQLIKGTPQPSGAPQTFDLAGAPGYKAVPDGKGGWHYLKVEGTEAPGQANIRETLGQAQMAKSQGAKTAILDSGGLVVDPYWIAHPWAKIEPIDDVIGRLQGQLAGGATKGTNATDVTDGLKTVTSKAEYEALPAGTQFRGSDGKLYRKK